MSRFPIVKLAEKVAKMQQDGRLLSVKTSIEVVRGRILQLAGRIDFNDAPDRMNKLHELWEEFEDAHDRGKASDELVLMDKIHKEFQKAREDYAVWRQMFEALDLDSKLVEREVKVVKEIRAILTAEDAYDMITKLLGIITRYVTDPKTLKAIQYEFTRLIGERPSDYPDTNAGGSDLEEDLEDLEGVITEDLTG
jgi:hypothetical protein